jgi:capsular polysaccharide biosynthesis protein/Mrp family chromosome partitioning ATPase
MNASQAPDSFAPGEFLRVLRRRWLVVLGLTIVGVLGAVAYVKVAPATYTSSASVYVTATGADASQSSSGRSSGTVNLVNEAQLVQSISVATIAAHELHTTISPAVLSTHVTVTVPANSAILKISCSEPTASSSAACAQAFATAYLQNRTATSNDQLNAMLSTLRAQAAPLQQNVAALTAKIATLPSNSSERATAAAQLSSDQSELSAINHQIGVTTAAEAGNSGGSIISSAVVPTKPSSPQRKLILGGGLVVGLLLGLVLAFLVDSRNKRVHGPADVERHLDLPVLLSVPSKQRKPSATLAAPRSQAGQLFAELASSTTASLGEGNHVLFVAGCTAGAGTSVAAASLATALARTHPDVVLICADVHHSVVPELFGLDQGPGLAEVLAGKATVSEVAERPADTPRLRVITPGLDTGLVSYDFQLDVVRRLIHDLRRGTSMVIIEAQAAGTSADTFSLGEFADTALVVVEVGRTKRPEIEEALHRLAGLRTTVLGAVLVPRFGMPATLPVVRRGPETAKRAVGPADERSALRSQQRPAVKAAPGPRSSRSQEELYETRPLPSLAQQSRARRDAGPQSANMRRAKPTGTTDEG